MDIRRVKGVRGLHALHMRSSVHSVERQRVRAVLTDNVPHWILGRRIDVDMRHTGSSEMGGDGYGGAKLYLQVHRTRAHVRCESTERGDHGNKALGGGDCDDDDQFGVTVGVHVFQFEDLHLRAVSVSRRWNLLLPIRCRFNVWCYHLVFPIPRLLLCRLG